MSQIFGIFRNRNIAKITVYFFFSLLLLLCIVPDGYGAGYTCSASSKKYTSCKSGYYLNGTGAGNSCSTCSSLGYTSSANGNSNGAAACYKSCTKACTRQTCPSSAYSCSHGSTSTSGTQYYGGSCSAPSSTCSLTINSCKSGYYKNGNSCATCSSLGYTSSANGNSNGAAACYKSCTRACTRQTCPSNATCTHGSTSTSGTQYYGGSCSAASSTCSISISCNSGYYKSGSSCPACTSVSATDLSQSCSRNPTSTELSNAHAYAGTISGAKQQCTGKHTGGAGGTAGSGSCTGCSSWGTCSGGTLTITSCSAGYYKDGNSCKSCPSGYTSANGTTGGIGSCYINVSAGNYIKAANSSTQSTCTAGYWNPAHTVYYGNTSSCNKCTGTTYSDTDGASSCKQCPTATEYADIITSYWYWSEDDIHDTIGGCRAEFDESDSKGSYNYSCAYKNGDYGVAGGGTGTCMATKPNSCAATYYWPGGDSNIWAGNRAELLTQMCSSVGKGYWSAAGSLTRSQCPANYRDGAAAGSQAGCKTSCAAGTYVATANAACTSVGTGYYRAAHTVSYGSTSTRSQCPANYRDGAAAGSQAGCKTSCAAGTYVATANAACTSVGTGYYRAAHTVSYGSTSTRSQCPANYRDGAAAGSQNNCIGIFEKTGGQNNPTKPTGCATMEYASSCTPPTCEYQKNYAGTVVKDCTPGNCTKAITKLTANADRYVNGTTSCPACSSYSSTYTKSDGGSITYNSCYITRSKTGSQVNGSTPSGCASVTAWYACTPGTCTYKDYLGQTGETCTPSNCTKSPKTVTAKENYYVSGATCPACSSYSSTYTKSDGGSITYNSCYITRSKTGSQVNGSTPSGCASVTAWNACTPGKCTYKDYLGQTGETCTPSNCTKTPKTVRAKENYYVSGTSCPACSSYSSTYTKSDGGSISSAYCYRTATKTGSQVNGSTPSGCASVTAWNACTPGTCTYKDYASATDTTCTPSNCTKTPKTVTAKENYYVSGTSCPACSSYSSTYTKSDGGSISSAYCYRTATKTGSQVNGSTPSGCASVTAWNACTPGTCTYKDYASATDTTCTPSNCTKTPKTVTAKENYYVSGTSCPTCPTGYPNSDGGTGGVTVCYSNTKSRAWTGSQVNGSTPSGCASVTAWNACSKPACSYVAYSNSAGTGDGEIKSGCSSNSASCTKTPKTVTAKENYYVSGTSCPTCPTGYPNSDGGTGGVTVCYSNTKSRAWTGSQVNGSTPSGCASVTAWNACSKPACSYVAYSNSAGTGDGTIKSGCSSNSASCTKNPKTVTAKENYYVSGTSCPTCPTGYPNSAGGNIGQSMCYKTCEDIDITGGTNVPTSGTAYYGNSCTYTTVCDDGYNLTGTNTCSQLCTLGVTSLRTGNGVTIPLYSSALSTPSLNIGTGGGVCYGILESGAGTLNIQYDGKTYHAVD